MNKPTTISIVFLTLVIGLGTGFLAGQKHGQEQGIIAKSFERAQLECVFLTLSSRAEKNGDKATSHKLKYRLLFAAAHELDHLASNGKLNHEQQDTAFKIVRGVIDHARLYPDSISCLNKHTRTEVEKLCKNYPELEDVE